MRPPRTALLVLAAALAAVGLPACGGDGGAASTTASSAAPASTAAAATSGWTAYPTDDDLVQEGDGEVLPPLQAIPAEGVGLVRAAGLRRAAQAAGVDPATASPADLVGAYARGLVVAPALLAVADAGGLADEVGFALGDLDWVVEWGTPPATVTAFRGAIDPARVDAAVRSFAPFAADVVREERDGFAVYGFGDDRVDPRRRSALRPLGIGGHLAVTSGLALFSNDRAALDAAVAAAVGGPGSLADASGVAEVYGALLEESLSYELVPAPAGAAWTASGIGASGTLADPAALLVLAYPDEAAAQAGAEALRAVIRDGRSLVTDEPWNEVFAGEGPEVEGTTVRLRAAGHGARVLLEAPVVRDLVWAEAAPA